MARELEAVFRELGLAQYLDSFVDQGFDTWDTILDIQESDLDALGVKLGHRRKLQRRIANARGIAPSISLASPVKPTHDDAAKSDGSRSEHSRADAAAEGSGQTKRKYRRHPKNDENAPERPPSAYVLFSNKMREDLKNHNLTFTEIAKLVGENWQSLPAAEKEAYESQANAAKEKYHRDMTEYKKTETYRKYAAYLVEFKDKQAKQNQDSSKRPKMEPARLRHGSTSSGTTPNTSNSSRSGSGSGSRSGSERVQGSEPPPNRHERLNSTTSLPDGHYGNHGLARMPPGVPTEDSRIPPRVGPTDQHYGNGRQSRRENGRVTEGAQPQLPSLSDMLDDSRSSVSDAKPFTPGVVSTNTRRTVPDGPPLAMPPHPSMRHEESSTGSSTSSGSYSSLTRSSGDGPLPIHALLSSRAGSRPGSTYSQASSPTFSTTGSLIDGVKPPMAQRQGPQGYGFQAASSVLEPMRVERLGDGDILMTSDPSPPANSSRKSGGLDGMSALLRAGELVSRHGRP